MTREEKIAAITNVCAAACPDDPQVRSVVRLRNVVIAFRKSKVSYTIGAQGYFLDPKSLTATHARWDAFQNDLTKQSDRCVEFLYECFVHSR
jgi:hypothetical protein